MVSVIVDPVSMVEAGKGIWDWADLVLSHPEVKERLRVRVMKQPMKLAAEGGEPVVFSVSASELQEIADRIDGIMHTTKTLDARHANCNTLIQPVLGINNVHTGLLSDAEVSEVVLAGVETIRRATGRPDPGIVSSMGKTWVLCKWMTSKYARMYGDRTAHAFGWYGSSGRARSPAGYPIMQPLVSPDSQSSLEDSYKDSTTVAHLLSANAFLVNEAGREKSIRLPDVYQHEKFWKLVSYEGPLPVRQPSVPRYLGNSVSQYVEMGPGNDTPVE